MATGLDILQNLSHANPSISEPGQPSKPTTFTCKICVTKKPTTELVQISNCSHSCCSVCVRTYLIFKINSKATKISCPDSNCNYSLTPRDCEHILCPSLIVKWRHTLDEEFIPFSLRLYCPFQDCSALQRFDFTVETQCSVCYRKFCAQCNVPWTSGHECKTRKPKKKTKEDELLNKLAKRKKWVLCQKCKLYVDRAGGCKRMICRCSHSFCYKCGEHRCQCRPVDCDQERRSIKFTLRRLLNRIFVKFW